MVKLVVLRQALVATIFPSPFGVVSLIDGMLQLENFKSFDTNFFSDLVPKGGAARC